MLIELFGNIYKEVEDLGSECECLDCSLFELCELTKPKVPCERADGSLNRHFIRVSTKLNTKE